MQSQQKLVRIFAESTSASGQSILPVFALLPTSEAVSVTLLILLTVDNVTRLWGVFLAIAVEH